MNPQRPEYLRPALIAGAVAGLLSGLPFIGAGNCICCLWIVGGAAIAAKLLAAATPGLLKAGDGAVVGALTGIVAAVVDAVVSIPLRSFNLGLARRLLDKAVEFGGEMPTGLDEIVNGSSVLSVGWFLLGLFISAAVFAIMGTLGGIIGVSLFGKKSLPPASSRPPGRRCRLDPPMRLKTKVIVNPESNRGRTRKRWGEIREGLRHFVREFKFEFTEQPLHATDIARQAIKDGTELVIGVGGDGTMNEIANGFYEDRRIINPEATLGVVPSGTGCDLVRSLNIPAGLKGALQVITDAPSVRMDVGRVRYTSNSGAEEERFFLNIADFGLGGEVVREVTERRLRRKATSYVRCLVTTMARYRNKSVRIRIDGRDLPDGEYLIGAVANGKIFGKGMKVAPGAELDDGLFDAVLIRGFRSAILPPRLEAHERGPCHPP